MPIASEVMDSAAALLNDANKYRFTYEKMLPLLKVAWEEYQIFMQERGIPTVQEIHLTATLIAGDNTIATPPHDLIVPLSVSERRPNSQDLFGEITESQIPEMNPTDSVQFWEWRDNKIFFNVTNQDREVRIRFLKQLNPVIDENTFLNAISSTTYLVKKTAAYCARYIGEDPSRADTLDLDAERMRLSALNMEVKNLQSHPVRPAGYGGRR